MTCTCIEEMDAKLAEHNTRLSVTLGFPHDGSPAFVRPHLQTEKIETRKRVGPALAVPSFCPFCGTRYEIAPATPAGEPSNG
ncbi:MAG: hypothetical protein CVT77_09555 [Alphaproteobacteria bacterium HGW-Alphaproteobacteria-16]|nr:MAG: hypothetical protein CVT77_09555 [Alphaproteobacteria bacterium HGW-Alphaproteobacteria-16]